ncbi:MAG: polysaccharide pyruvyl transferase family protein [Prevotella sp.]|nr:polysaccharide pyruvyl transferase family protein [Prevotella sp.]
MKNKKIALVTCYFQPNYGSQLQAYATQWAFDKLGLDNETICIEGLRGEIRNAKLRYFFSKLLDPNTVKDKMATVRKLLAIKRNPDYARNLGQRMAKFKEFDGAFRISKPYSSLSELGENAHKYGAFVVGSDQLWLPSNISANYYTLNFVPEDICKIALATSFGVSFLPRKQAKMAEQFLNRMDAISVREESGKKLVKELTGKDVPVVCDPTILFSGEEWQHLIPQTRYDKEPYLFCYFLGNNPVQREFVKRIKEKTGYKIVQLQHCDEYISSDMGFPDETPWRVGPKEFVQLIRDAEMVFTDSFHCSVFSMLQKKKFYAFRRYPNDGKVSTNGRLYSLLSSVGLMNQLMNEEEDIEDALKMDMDYDRISAALAQQRDFTWDWLKSNLHKAQLL